MSNCLTEHNFINIPWLYWNTCFLHTAKLLRIKLPVTYSKKDDVDKTRLQYGMSFAYGGTGVFDTKVNYPNMTGQINLFEQLLGNVYSPSDLSSSVALVSVAGNDYLYFLSTRSPAVRKHRRLINTLKLTKKINTLFFLNKRLANKIRK